MIVNGFLDWAEQVPGPPDKSYSESLVPAGYVPHSAVGYYNGWASRLFDLTKYWDSEYQTLRYTANAAASVHLWIAYDGSVKQHYAFDVGCWASGNRTANLSRVAAENEGGHDPVNEPLTIPQILSNVRIIKELSGHYGWAPTRNSLNLSSSSLLEHNECVTLWGGSSTGCPNNRIPWSKFMGLLNYQEEDEMVVGQFAKAIPWTKSYVVTVGKEGARKTLVPSATEYESLFFSGFPVKVMPVTQLRKIISSPGTPEP